MEIRQSCQRCKYRLLWRMIIDYFKWVLIDFPPSLFLSHTSPHVNSTPTATGGERRRPSTSLTSLKRRRPLVDEVIEVQWRRNTSLNDPLDDDHHSNNKESTSSSVSVSLHTPTGIIPSKPTSSSLSATTSTSPSSSPVTRETKAFSEKQTIDDRPLCLPPPSSPTRLRAQFSQFS